MRIEDYALIGDLQTAALVGRDGSIDWLCLPRFDSPSCFTALLGDASHGRWLLAPTGETRSCARRYRPGTLVLETDTETDDGAVRVIDFMPRRGDGQPQLVRVVVGLRGRVAMRSELTLRPDYGAIVPWIDAVPDGVLISAGPDAFHLSNRARRDRSRRHGGRRVRDRRGLARGVRDELAPLRAGQSAGRERPLGARAHRRLVARAVGTAHL